MLIDWFTVGAQIVNFLVLMALLKIFLYDRVIRAMDAREEKIAGRLEEARRKRREAQEQQEALEDEKQSLEDKRQEMLSEAREKARAKRRELEDRARAEVDERRARWREALDEDKERFAREVENSALEHALEVARRVVEDMADENFQERIVTAFVDRIRQMPRAHKDALVERLDGDPPAARIVSGEAVSTAQRQKITRLLHEELHPDLDVDYRTVDDLPAGIELRVPGQKVTWSPREYIEDLREELLRKLASASGPPEEKATGDEQEERDARQG